MTTFIGVDPGETTGVSLWYGLTPKLDWTAQLRDPTQVAAALAGFIDEDTVMGCERFIITSKTHQRNHGAATDVIGDLQGLCTRKGATFKRQTASDAKSLVTNDMLRRLDWYSSGLRHVNDATRHLLLVVARIRPSLFAELVDH